MPKPDANNESAPPAESPEARELRRRRELAAAESRFRARQRQRAGEVSEHHEVKAIRRRQRTILRWTFLGSLAVVGIAYFASVHNAEPPPEPTPVAPSKPAPLLNLPDRVPAGTKEVQGEIQAGDGLAPGSELAIRTQLETAKTWQLPLEIENSVGMRFRLIPPGTFLMGSKLTEPGRGPDEPEHVQTIRDPFYIGVFEVTQAQWNAVMGAGNNPSIFTRNGDNRPVEEVTWDVTRDFLKKLAKRDGVPATAYRLPLEAEWEYACRAGTTTPFYTGTTREDLRRAANFTWNNERGTAQVGLRQANGWGLYDMHGNVWEWCENVFQDYLGDKKIDPYRRVIRGGNWKLPWLDCRSASRYRLTTTSHGNILGLRVVRVLSPAELAVPEATPEDPTPPPEP